MWTKTTIKLKRTFFKKILIGLMRKPRRINHMTRGTIFMGNLKEYGLAKTRPSTRAVKRKVRIPAMLKMKLGVGWLPVVLE